MSSSFLIFFTRSCGLSASSALVDDECCCWPEGAEAAAEPCCCVDCCDEREGGGPTGAGDDLTTVVAAAALSLLVDGSLFNAGTGGTEGSLLNTRDELETLGVVGEVALGELSFGPSGSDLTASSGAPADALAADSLTVRALSLSYKRHRVIFCTSII